MKGYFGIDYGSRRIAVASLVDLPDGSLAHRIWVQRYGDDWDTYAVLADVYDLVATRQQAFAPLVIAIESPIVGASKNAQTAVKMSMMAGSIAAAAGKGSSGIVLVPPSSWKASVVGRGNAGKHDVAAWLLDNHPHIYEECIRERTGKVDQDAVDASCLALYARSALA